MVLFQALLASFSRRTSVIGDESSSMKRVLFGAALCIYIVVAWATTPPIVFWSVTLGLLGVAVFGMRIVLAQFYRTQRQAMKASPGYGKRAYITQRLADIMSNTTCYSAYDPSDDEDRMLEIATKYLLISGRIYWVTINSKTLVDISVEDSRNIYEVREVCCAITERRAAITKYVYIKRYTAGEQKIKWDIITEKEYDAAELSDDFDLIESALSWPTLD